MLRKILMRLFLDAEWAFLGLLCALTGLSTVNDPRESSLRVVLEEVSPFVPQIYALFLLLGGVMTIVGLGMGFHPLQRIGLFALLPPMVFTEAILLGTGDKTRIWVHLVYIAFIGLITARIYKLWQFEKTVAGAVAIVKEVQDRDV